MSPEQIFEMILTDLRQVVPFDGASVLTRQDGHLVIIGGAGWSNLTALLGLKVELTRHETYRSFLKRATPVIVEDVRQQPHVQLEPLSVLGQRAWLGLPVKLAGRMVGWLGLAKREPGYFTPEHIRQTQPFLRELAIAIEAGGRYRSEQERRIEAEQRREVAESLGDMLAVLNSNKSLDEIVSFIAAQTNQLLGSDANAIYRQEVPDGSFRRVAMQGDPADNLTERERIVTNEVLADAVTTHEPVILSKISGLGPGRSTHYQALLALPLLIKGEVYGGIILYYRQPRNFSMEEIELATIFGDQVALAIENARLRIEVEQAATMAERHRLAQELHDAVSQTLFSVSAIAEALPRVWVRYPEEGQRGLEQLHLLSRTALAEMRTLLLELRPTALAETRLAELLQQLADAMAGRLQAPVELTVAGDHPLPGEVKLVFYRIAQEALHNIVKHARADQVRLQLDYQPEQATLHISDTGRGFDPEAILSHQLGLNIMKERAKSIGAQFRIDSQPDHGTQVTLVWPDQSGRNNGKSTTNPRDDGR